MKRYFSGKITRGFFQYFSRGGKSGEICFFPLKTKKTTLFCWKCQNPGGKVPSAPSSDAHAREDDYFERLQSDPGQVLGSLNFTVLNIDHFPPTPKRPKEGVHNHLKLQGLPLWRNIYHLARGVTRLDGAGAGNKFGAPMFELVFREQLYCNEESTILGTFRRSQWFGAWGIMSPSRYAPATAYQFPMSKLVAFAWLNCSACPWKRLFDAQLEPFQASPLWAWVDLGMKMTEQICSVSKSTELQNYNPSPVVVYFHAKEDFLTYGQNQVSSNEQKLYIFSLKSVSVSEIEWADNTRVIAFFNIWLIRFSLIFCAKRSKQKSFFAFGKWT